MNPELGIEVREIPELDMGSLPKKMYEGVEKRWSQTGIYLPQEIIFELQQVVEQYLRVMGLDSTIYPARVDIGFSQYGNPVIYEITTGFVDQVGSCISLQQVLADDTGIESLSNTAFDSSVLTSNPYAPEYKVMREMFERSGKSLMNQGEKTFVYGYPLETMKDDTRFIPGWKGLNAENKFAQSQVIERLANNTSFVLPRTFAQDRVSYSDLPNDKYSKLVFKKVLPKIKGDRNTVIFGKGNKSQEGYESGGFIAQEYIPAYRDQEGRRYESKVIFMPSANGTNFTGMYALIDDRASSRNFGATTIPNDGYPQGPGIIIS